MYGDDELLAAATKSLTSFFFESRDKDLGERAIAAHGMYESLILQIIVLSQLRHFSNKIANIIKIFDSV